MRVSGLVFHGLQLRAETGQDHAWHLGGGGWLTESLPQASNAVASDFKEDPG